MCSFRLYVTCASWFKYSEIDLLTNLTCGTRLDLISGAHPVFCVRPILNPHHTRGIRTSLACGTRPTIFQMGANGSMFFLSTL